MSTETQREHTKSRKNPPDGALVREVEADTALLAEEHMATHSLHADIHDYGLADGCDRCAELARNPFALDERAFSEVARRVSHELPGRSAAEQVAIYELTRIMQQAERIKSAI